MIDPDLIHPDLARKIATTRSERYQSWLKGWRDGAVGTVKARVFLEHRRTDLRDAYEVGYAAGLAARGDASAQASTYSGHQPSILRGSEEPDAPSTPTDGRG